MWSQTMTILFLPCYVSALASLAGKKRSIWGKVNVKPREQTLAFAYKKKLHYRWINYLILEFMPSNTNISSMISLLYFGIVWWWLMGVYLFFFSSTRLWYCTKVYRYYVCTYYNFFEWRERESQSPLYFSLCLCPERVRIFQGFYERPLSFSVSMSLPQYTKI